MPRPLDWEKTFFVSVSVTQDAVVAILLQIRDQGYMQINQLLVGRCERVVYRHGEVGLSMIYTV